MFASCRLQPGYQSRFETWKASAGTTTTITENGFAWQPDEAVSIAGIKVRSKPRVNIQPKCGVGLRSFYNQENRW